MNTSRVLDRTVGRSANAGSKAAGPITDCMLVCSRTGKIQHHTSSARELFGAAASHLYNQPILDFVNVLLPGEAHEHKLSPDELFERAVRRSHEASICVGNLAFRFDDVVSPLLADDGEQVLGWIWRFEYAPEVLDDIFKHAHQFIDALSEAVFIVDEHDVLLYANQRFCGLTGLARTELINQNLSELFDAGFDEGSLLADPGKHEAEFRGRYLNTILSATGERLWVEVGMSSMDAIIKQQGVRLGIISNVTARMRAELAAQRSSEKLRKFVQYLPVAITSYNVKDGRYDFVNQEFQRQSGYALESFEQLTEEKLIEMIYHEDRDRIFSFYKRWQEDGFPGRQNVQYRIVNRGGEIVWLDTYLFAELNDDGVVEIVNQICVDVTRLRTAQTALENALRQDFRRTVENLQNLVFKLVRRADGAFVYRLREGKLAGSITSEVVFERSPDEIFGSMHRDRVGPHIKDAFDGKSVRFEMEFEGQWLFYVLEPVFDGDLVQEVVGSAVDITELKKVELRLRDSEARNRRLIDAIPLGIMQIVITSSGQVSYIANRAFEAQTGYSVKEFVRMSNDEASNIYHPDDSERVNQLWTRWFSEDSPSLAHDLYRFRHKSGEYRYMEMYATRFKAESGERYYIQAAMDVTEKKVAENRLKLLATFPEQNSNPIFEISIAGKVSYQNRVALAHFPKIGERGFDDPLLAWLQPHLQELVAKPGKTIRHEYESEKVVYDLSVSYLPEGEILRIFCHIITEQKQAERQLRRALETERELNALKTRFVSTVSHEFRTPLAGILSSAEILERYTDRLAEERRQEEIGKIKKRVTELTHLMDDFLLQSSLPAAGERLTYGEFNLAQLCIEVVDNIQATDDSAATIKFVEGADLQSNIVGDARLLRQVIKNLLSNAMKYSDSGSPVTMELVKNNGALRLSVTDQGIGIPKEEQVRLFAPFFRASNVLQRPGTGIGLSLVKEFVELHGGTIEVESSVGVGSTFTVLLPHRQSEVDA